MKNVIFDGYFHTLRRLPRQVTNSAFTRLAKRFEKLDTRVMEMLFPRGRESL